jgi:hypothetical protein
VSKQVTLTVSDEVYRQAEAIARNTDQDVTEVLADAIALGWPPPEDDEEHRAMAREEIAYRTMHAELYAKYPDQYVAIYQGEVVDRDTDLEAICDRVDEKYPNEVVLIKRVLSTSEETFVFRSPRVEYS